MLYDLFLNKLGGIYMYKEIKDLKTITKLNNLSTSENCNTFVIKPFQNGIVMNHRLQTTNVIAKYPKVLFFTAFSSVETSCFINSPS